MRWAWAERGLEEESPPDPVRTEAFELGLAALDGPDVHGDRVEELRADADEVDGHLLEVVASLQAGG